MANTAWRCFHGQDGKDNMGWHFQFMRFAIQYNRQPAYKSISFEWGGPTYRLMSKHKSPAEWGNGDADA
jgi:hypothetical protein